MVINDHIDLKLTPRNSTGRALVRIHLYSDLETFRSEPIAIQKSYVKKKNMECNSQFEYCTEDKSKDSSQSSQHNSKLRSSSTFPSTESQMGMKDYKDVRLAYSKKKDKPFYHEAADEQKI